MTAASATRPPSLTPPVVPVRSPRTSLILAELARQRRHERRQRRLKRQARRCAWARVSAWLAALGRWPFESARTHAAPELLFAGSTPLVYALERAW
jgi:hypothetical protein